MTHKLCMNKQVTIRGFKLDDVERVMDMLQDVSQFNPENANLEHLATDFLENEGAYACVAVYDKRVIGFGSVFILNRIRGGRSAVIEDIVVDGGFRRRGVGRLIINKLLGNAKEQNCFKATLVAAADNTLFYKSLGFNEDFPSMKLMF